jgi:NAD(P)-dependent dehydrogenase (short-subunit alcohol dehydrogenase family)
MNPRIGHWAGKRVWMIGASTGIGAAAAGRLLGLGARVALSARNAGALGDAAARWPNALAAPLDVTDHASVLRARDLIVAAWGGIDLVLVVAGGYNEMRADSFDLAAANGMIDLNVRGVFNCLDAVLPVLLRQGAGGIGIVASVAGYGGLPKALAYGATKAALINLAESLFLDLRPRGIAVYQINPGFVDTPLTAHNDFRMPALMSAADAAGAMLDGIEAGQFHIHFPKRLSKAAAGQVAAIPGIFLVGPQNHRLMNYQTELERLVQFYENVSVASLALLPSIYAPDARFKDPFNEVRGIEPIVAIFRHMFEQVEQPRFVVATRVLQGADAFLVWDFSFRMKRFSKARQCIRGATHIRFGADGAVVLHRDYWDAAEELYEKLPVVGALMRWLKSAANT